jgi:hypothetical protein
MIAWAVNEAAQHFSCGLGRENAPVATDVMHRTD